MVPEKKQNPKKNRLPLETKKKQGKNSKTILGKILKSILWDTKNLHGNHAKSNFSGPAGHFCQISRALRGIALIFPGPCGAFPQFPRALRGISSIFYALRGISTIFRALRGVSSIFWGPCGAFPQFSGPCGTFPPFSGSCEAFPPFFRALRGISTIFSGPAGQFLIFLDLATYEKQTKTILPLRK